MLQGLMAMSLDGYAADKDGSVAFLDRYNTVDFGFESFFAGIGSVVMGRRTYDDILGMSEVWPYRERPTLVLTSSPLTEVRGNAETVASLDALIARLPDLPQDVWVVGGCALQAELLARGLIRRLSLSIVPVLLGEGIPVFPRGLVAGDLPEPRVVQHDLGLVSLIYDFEDSSAFKRL